MTAVVTWDVAPVAFDDVADPPYAPHRNVRVAGPRWAAFGAAVGDRKRSAWLSEFINWVIPDGPLWRAAQTVAERRDESLGEVIRSALRRYVAKNRHLLDD